MSLIMRILLVFTLLYTAEAGGKDLQNNSDDHLIAPIRHELEEKETGWQFGLHGLFGFLSDDADARYGFGLMLENDFPKPLVIQSSLGLCFSRLKTIFPGQKFLSFSGELDVLYRAEWRKFSPYFGGGIGVISNRYPTGNPAPGSSAPYDEYTPEEEMDFGTRFGLHLTMGMLYQLSEKVSLMLDIRRSPSRISCPVLVTRFPPVTITKETRDYRISAYTVRIGIAGRIFK